MSAMEFLKKHTTLTYLLLGILACISALSFRKGAGIWMMLPIYPLCVAVGSFLPVKRWQRGAFFLLLVLILNAVECKNTMQLLLPAVMTVCVFALTEGAVFCFRKKKKALVLSGVCLLAVCLFTNAYVFGNPVSAFLAKQKLDKHIEETYDTEQGGLFFRDFRFDRSSRCYVMTAGTDELPGETGDLIVSGDTVIDRFQWVLEDIQMQPEAYELGRVLREAFPSDLFAVLRKGIHNYPANGQKRSANDATDYRKDTDYEIRISGTPTYKQLIETAQAYTNTLQATGETYRSIVFSGGAHPLYRITVTLDEQSGLLSDGIQLGVTLVYHPRNHVYLETNGILRFLEQTAKTGA